MAAAALAAAPEVDAEPRFRRSRSRAGSVCAVDDAIGSIRIDDDEEEVGEFGRERSLGAGSDAATPVDADADDADDDEREEVSESDSESESEPEEEEDPPSSSSSSLPSTAAAAAATAYSASAASAGGTNPGCHASIASDRSSVTSSGGRRAPSFLLRTWSQRRATWSARALEAADPCRTKGL